MKLGEMQRFKYIPRTHTIEGEYGGYFDRADDGDFVRFSDHQSSLAEREQRIAALRTALKHEVDNCVNCSGTGRYVTHHEGGYEFTVTCERCAHGRAALAATEGEGRE